MNARYEPITDKHKDGQPHLTDQGWVVWKGCNSRGDYPDWWICRPCGERLECVDEGGFPVQTNPTFVITLNN